MRQSGIVEVRNGTRAMKSRWKTSKEGGIHICLGSKVSLTFFESQHPSYLWDTLFRTVIVPVMCTMMNWMLTLFKWILQMGVGYSWSSIL